jgi:predicted metal-dependent enzyme (double-stranded beta helix superfamily)
MDANTYTLEQYAADLRTIAREETDEKEVLRRVAPLSQALATSPGFIRDEYRQCNEEQGYAFHLLHEEADHSNAVFVIAWLPDRGTPAHNHKTWGVVVGMEGEETETWWRRIDDGSKAGWAELEHQSESAVTAGKVSCLLSDDIHTVWNNSDQVSLSLHTYGMHINHSGRSEFDPEAKTEKPIIVIID